MTPDKKLLSPFLFTKNTKCKSLFSLLNISVKTYIPGPGAYFANYLCSWHTNLFSCIPSQPHVMPPTLGNTRYISQISENTRYVSQISENTRYIFQNTKYIIPVANFASHLILCCWHTNHLLLYPWNLRRKPFGFSESADCED